MELVESAKQKLAVCKGPHLWEQRVIDYFEMGKDKKDKHNNHDKKRKRDKDDEARQAEKARKLVSTASSSTKRGSKQSWAAQPVTASLDESCFIHSTIHWSCCCPRRPRSSSETCGVKMVLRLSRSSCGARRSRSRYKKEKT